MVVVAVFVPNPTPFQFTVFRTTLATAVACVAASVPGFLLQDGASSEEPRQAGWIQLGGGVVMFLLVYGVDPVRRIGRGVRRSEDAPARTFAPEQSIFICYRHADSAEMADRLHERLAARYGDLAVFKDIEDIPLGVDFREVLKEALRRCKVVLALIGPDWETVAGETGRPKIDNPGDYVRNEIESSLERGLPVIPLLVRRTSLPPPDRLPPSMGKLPYLNMMEIRPDPDFDNDVARLVANVDRLLERK